MNNTNKILIGAILILFIGFLVNYNGNVITGKDDFLPGDGFGDGLGDGLGDGIVIGTPPPEFTCTARHTEHYLDTGNLLKSRWVDITNCEDAIDGDDSTKIGGLGYYYIQYDDWEVGGTVTKKGSESYELTINFNEKEINTISVTPGVAFYSGWAYIYKNDVEQKRIQFFSPLSSESIKDFSSILADKIVVKWSGNQAGGTYTYLKDVEVKNIQESDCSDTDEGENMFMDGTATGVYGSLTDECWSLNYDPKHKKYGNFKALGGCNRGDPVPGGYMDGCYVNEAYCENGVAKQKLITCTAQAPACYDGKCACLYDEQCPDGYECRLARPDDQQNTRKICKQVAGPPPVEGCAYSTQSSCDADAGCHWTGSDSSSGCCPTEKRWNPKLNPPGCQADICFKFFPTHCSTDASGRKIKDCGKILGDSKQVCISPFSGSTYGFWRDVTIY